MAYVIKRTDGVYVAPSGSVKSYTSKLENARQYRTRDEALQDRCEGNERVIDVNDLLRN